MNKVVTSVVAALASFAIPFVAVAPASALTPLEISNLTQTFDCDTMSYTNQGVGLWDSPVDVLLVNCDGYYLGDQDNTGDAETEDGTVDSSGTLLVNDVNELLTLSGEVDVYFLTDPGANDFAMLAARDIYDMANPAGSLVVDSAGTISLDPVQFTIGSQQDITDENEITIDGNGDCGILAGDHIYTIQRFHVTIAGQYTFRVVGTDPVSSYIQVGQYNPISDPMIALYDGEFDPANADSAVEGCNDDFNDLTIDGYNWSIPNSQSDADHVYATTEDGTAIEGHFPVFTADLAVGDYSMLVTTFDNLSAEEWANGQHGEYVWEAGVGTIEYEVWGNPVGIEAVDEFALASTGVDPSFGLWSGLALAGTGVAITVARRRAQRS